MTNEKGESVSGLTANDFTLLDNGAPTKVLSFRASEQATEYADRLTEVVIVLDEVNLPHNQSEAIKRETVNFLRMNDGRLSQPVSIYWLTPAGFLATADPTIDGNMLAQAVARGHSDRTLT